MQDLKALFESLRFTQVRTLLNSGNVLFDTARPNRKKLAATIASAFEARFGFSSKVTLITAETLEAIIAANPLLESVQDPARHFVAFAADETVWVRLKPLAKQDWRPDALVIGEAAAYLWCLKGALDSPLSKAFGKAAGDAVTLRNWATVLKIRAAAVPPT